MTVASLASRSRLRPQLLWVLAALSVALNLFFIVGALWIRIHRSSAAAQPRRAAAACRRRAVTGPATERGFRPVCRHGARAMQLMHKTVDPLVGKAGRRSPNRKPARRMSSGFSTSAGDARRGFMRELAPVTLSFLATLSPEQRAKFVELIRQKPWGHVTDRCVVVEGLRAPSAFLIFRGGAFPREAPS